MNIKAKITGIPYKIYLREKLEDIDIKDFNINNVSSTCLLYYNQNSFAISKWVSPKRTRSYPYERVYNSLNISKKITIIPIVKDEGRVGDRDFLQWDTVSLMSLLDVFVIFAYYDKAIISSKNSQKITSQQFNNSYVLSKVKEIANYHSSALHWNLKEIKNLDEIINKVKKSYNNIQRKTGVALHDFSGIDNFKEKIGQNSSSFISFSREKSKQAQSREVLTKQPKERLSNLSKAKITISNYLGGKYFFTVDEINITDKKLELIESKHSKSELLPSKADIKDGLLKMILYCNLKKVNVEGRDIESQPILKLTSAKLKGTINSLSKKEEWSNFFKKNTFSKKQTEFIENLFKEGEANSFIVKMEYSK